MSDEEKDKLSVVLSDRMRIFNYNTGEQLPCVKKIRMCADSELMFLSAIVQQQLPDAEATVTRHFIKRIESKDRHTSLDVYISDAMDEPNDSFPVLEI